MSNSEIVNYAVEQGHNLRAPLRDLLTDDHLEQIRYARENHVTWPAIAKYFKDREGIDFDPDSFRKTVKRLIGEDI